MGDKIRVGCIYISTECVKKCDNIPEIFYDIKFIPLRVEHFAFKDCYEYIGTSPSFDEIDIGSPAPEYTLEISGDIGNLNVCVKRIE